MELKQEVLNLAHIVPPTRDVQKMQYYKSKGSNPKRLVHDIRGNLDKLVSRYFLSIVMDWQEYAAEVERAQMAGELTPDFTREILDSTAIQAANSKLETPVLENLLMDAMRSLLDGEEIQDEDELDMKLSEIDKGISDKIKFDVVRVF